jgi:cellobiose-specific phosphotransferase system component IIC
VQLIIIVVTTLVWIPFVLMSNKQAQKEAGN